VDDAATPIPSPRDDAPVDLSVLERIEGELQAVERALEQIDQGVYDGFAGLDAAPPPAPQPAVTAVDGAAVTSEPAPADGAPPVGWS
jgi:hypothetical protein